MVRTFRRLLAFALVAGLTVMNVQAAELHVHGAAEQAADTHHHGPASHHHDVDHDPADAAAVVTVDADDSVVYVALVAAFAKSIKLLHAGGDVVALPDWGVPTTVDGERIVARAHGPPSIAQPALRAPPARLSL